jgi:RNA-directed DNA polymerase
MNEIILKKAWKIIRRNYGCPGPDGVSWQEIKSDYKKYVLKIERILQDPIDNNDYYKKTIIDYLGNSRDIYVYNIVSRWAQEYIKLVYQEVTEPLLSKNVYSYSKSRNLINMKYDMNKYLGKYFLRIDIEKYFSNIDLYTLGNVLRKYYYLNPTEIEFVLKFVYPKENGLPQGNVLSPYLSNLYFTELDVFLSNLTYFRYSDDIFILLEGVNGHFLKKDIELILERLNLKLNNQKTRYINNLKKEDLF